MAARKRKFQREESEPPLEPARLILDSGAVIALSRLDKRVRASFGVAIEAGSEVMIPAVVIAETIRGNGPRDAMVNRLVSDVDSVEPLDERSARTAGGLLGEARSNETIDALVVAAAIHAGGGRILTSDASHLRALSRGRPDVVIHSI